MNRILLSVISLVAVVGVAVAATGAYFSGTAASNGNTFSSGTLTLRLSDTDQTDLQTVTSSFGGSNLKPGDTLPQQVLTVKNTGTIDGNHLDFQVVLDTATTLAANLCFPVDDLYNGLRFGASLDPNASANLVNYLLGNFNDGDYDFFDGDDGTTPLFGVFTGYSKVTLADLASLGKIRVVVDSNSEGITASTTAYLWMHPVVDTALATQAETVTAAFNWNIDQDTSQF